MVDEEGGDDDPADREQTEKGAIGGGQKGVFRRHSINRDRQGNGDDCAANGGPVSFHALEGKCPKEKKDGGGGDQCRQEDIPRRVDIHFPWHYGVLLLAIALQSPWVLCGEYTSLDVESKSRSSGCQSV